MSKSSAYFPKCEISTPKQRELVLSIRTDIFVRKVIKLLMRDINLCECTRNIFFCGHAIFPCSSSSFAANKIQGPPCLRRSVVQSQAMHHAAKRRRRGLRSHHSTAPPNLKFLWETNKQPSIQQIPQPNNKNFPTSLLIITENNQIAHQSANSANN
eukprot:g23151.t1